MIDDGSPGPAFLIAGMQKCGTSALWRQLRAHPRLYFPPVKEQHFFDRESLDWAHPDYAVYERKFAERPMGAVAGEATPIYAYWPEALERIAAYRPEMKLIILLRDPAERAYSHWAMQFRRGTEHLDFGQAIRQRLNRPDAQADMKSGANRNFSYVERGFYAQQLERTFRLFPREQVLVATLDAFRLSHRSLLDRVCDFLELERFADYPPNERVMVAGQTAENPPMPGDCRAHLVDLFTDDILRTQAILGLDLSGWLDRG